MVYKDKSYKFKFSHFCAILVSVMFILTVVLSFKLLMKEQCDQVVLQESILDDTKHNKQSRNSVLYESDHKLAVLVPYRERFEELLEFVPHMHDFLLEQRINHDIFILNQIDTYRFNRASLINVGYLLTQRLYDYIAMHDVDLLPLNKQLSYAYPKQPFHLAAPNLHPRYHYEKFIGGILLINREQFRQVNGLSNKYWGWGLEDDEFYVRLKEANLTVHRPENITTGINNTFWHMHGKERKRDTTKCHNQREITRKRDRQTGLHDVKYSILGQKNIEISESPATIVNIKLVCNREITPWCDCSDKNNNKNKKVGVR